MTPVLRSAVRTAFYTVFFAIVTTAQVFAQDVEPTRLSLNDAPQAVEKLIGGGQLSAAREIALAAVRADPENPLFMLSLARTETRLGNFASAIALGRKAYRASDNPQIKFYAAQTVAQAHTSAGNLSRAQLWLRLARQFSPNAEIASRIAQDYGKLRALNPWSTSLNFGVTPSSNINNGSASTSSQLFGLPLDFVLSGDARALSGLQISGGTDIRYRLLTTENSATFLTASAFAQTYTLSQSARTQAPDVEGSDYAYGSLSFGVTHRQVLAQGANPTEFSLRNSRTWFGMEPYTRSIDGSISHTWNLGEADRLAMRAFAQKTVYFDGTPSAVGHGISGNWTHVLQSKDSFTLGVALRDNQSLARDADYRSVTYSAGYDLAKPVADMRFGFGADYETRDFASSAYAPGPRDDRSLGLNVSVNFANIEFYGFQPVIKFEARRNESSIDLFDRDYSSVAFDLRSSF